MSRFSFSHKPVADDDPPDWAYSLRMYGSNFFTALALSLLCLPGKSVGPRAAYKRCNVDDLDVEEHAELDDEDEDADLLVLPLRALSSVLSGTVSLTGW